MESRPMLQQVLGGTKNHSIQGATLLTKELKTQQGSYTEATCQIMRPFPFTEWLCLLRVTKAAMAPHSSTFAWKIPWTEEPGRLHTMGSLESDTTERLHFHFSLSRIGEGIGNPLQCSCLENPRDGGAWWAAVYGVAQSQTRLKRRSSSKPNKYISNTQEGP